MSLFCSSHKSSRIHIVNEDNSSQTYCGRSIKEPVEPNHHRHLRCFRCKMLRKLAIFKERKSYRPRLTSSTTQPVEPSPDDR